ncbi:MAG: hypothetical protein JKX97_02460 [Candidatus Lindowbacteria bacterium]|nr:hypothetical protein [Candidatus Lindowbacteria bacterium]
MRMSHKMLVAVSVAMILSNAAYAGHNKQKDELQSRPQSQPSNNHDYTESIVTRPFVILGDSVTVSPDQIVVQVNGVVCSFCAVGITKNASKLSFVDRSKYTKGVFTDIDNQRVTIAHTPGKQVDFKKIYKALRDGGYDPITIHLNLSGVVAKHGQHFMLADTNVGQAFKLIGISSAKLTSGKRVQIIAKMDAAQIPKQKSEGIWAVVVERLVILP